MFASSGFATTEYAGKIGTTIISPINPYCPMHTPYSKSESPFSDQVSPYSKLPRECECNC
jgi:hypothetical protein